MNDLSIKFKYHDAYIDKVDIQDDNVVLSVVLYPLTYIVSPTVQVEFLGIFNQKKVSEYFQNILSESDVDGEIGCVVETLHLDLKKKSVTGNIYIYLKTQWEGSVRIHCREFHEIKQ